MKVFDFKSKTEIKKLIKSGRVQVAVYGLGKMGLPLACVLADRKFQVLGVDINSEIVKRVNRGDNPVVGEKGLDKLLQKVVNKKKLRATTDGIEAARVADVMLVIVPTFLKTNKKPDLRAIEAAVKTIGQGMQKNSLVIMESTVPPGTTGELVKSILEKESDLRASQDFGLVFCPERTNSGTAIADIQGRINPKIVGGFDEKSGLAATAIYELINKKGVVLVSNLEVAEMVKVSEMVYRDVKIAYANSLALICDQMKINTREVIEAANTDESCEILRPGPGVGGHCIPVYPYFVFDKVKKNTDLLKSARKINDTMPDFVIEKIKKVLKEKGKKIGESNILLLGITYRGNVKETRLSPGLEIYKKLVGIVKEVFVFDPLYKKEEIEEMGLNFKDDYQGLDCVVVVCLHDSFRKLKFKKMAREMRTKIFIDTTLFFDLQEIKKANFAVRSIGFFKEKSE